MRRGSPFSRQDARIATGILSVLLLTEAASGAVSIGQRAPELRIALPGGVKVLLFLSAQCPVSNEYVGQMNALAREFAGRVSVVGVNSNWNESAEDMERHAREYRLGFPVYKDKDNVAADALGIAVTPQAVLLDGEGRLRYRGRIDDSQKIARVKREDLRRAVEAVLAGRSVPAAETKAFGCTIKRALAGVELQTVDASGYRSLLAARRGKVVLVNFWATWCKPCREEMPALVSLEARLGDRGLVLVTISVDEPEQRQAAGMFLAEVGLEGPAYIKDAGDDQALIRSVSAEWSGAVPALFLYDGGGGWRGRWSGTAGSRSWSAKW